MIKYKETSGDDSVEIECDSIIELIQFLESERSINVSEKSEPPKDEW